MIHNNPLLILKPFKLQIGCHPVAAVQYTFTHKQYTEQHKWKQGGFWKQKHAGEGANWTALVWKTRWVRNWELLEEVRWSANCCFSISLGWRSLTLSTNWRTGCKSWQFSYHSGTALTANCDVKWMWTIASVYITLLVFAWRQYKQCTCDVILRSFRVSIVWFRWFGEEP
jgi:hypothetical protein